MSFVEPSYTHDFVSSPQIRWRCRSNSGSFLVHCPDSLRRIAFAVLEKIVHKPRMIEVHSQLILLR